MRSWLGRLALLAAVAAAVPACGGGTPISDGTLSGLWINLRGGTGTGGDGGDGGYFYLDNERGGNVKLLPTGKVNSAFTTPLYAPYLGGNPRTITGAVTYVTVDALTGVNQILRGASTGTILGDDGLTAATGLWVTAGSVLNLPAHYDADDADLNGNTTNGTFESVYINVPYGVYVQGSIVAGRKDAAAQDDAASRNGGDLRIDGESIVVTGSIDTSGTDAAVGNDGGDGGDLFIYGQNNSQGAIVNTGLLDSTGGVGDNGGDGGDVYMDPDDHGVYNTGTIVSFGGAGNDGFGGDGGYIYFYADADDGGGAFNSGTLLSYGGDGTDGGGDGSYIYIYAEEFGATVSSGTLNSSGGSATVDGDGGYAGYIYFYAYTGTVRVTGSLAANGGNGAGMGDGGDANYIDIYSDDYDYHWGDSLSGGIYVGANLSSAGGHGVNGGDADEVYVYMYETSGYMLTGWNDICLVGYASVDASGGDGSVNGGDSDENVEVYAWDDYDYNGDYTVGSIDLRVPIAARGGNGGTGDGGYGAYVDIEQYDGLYGPYDRSIYVLSLDLQGGSGGDDGGEGGDVYGGGGFSATLRDINVSGGAGQGDTGGEGGYVEFYVDGPLLVRSIVANGGDSALDSGGYGDYIDLWATTVTVTGGISANGGSGLSVGFFGGDGADIFIVGTEDGSSIAGVSAAGGAGDTPGANGDVYIDGIHVSGP